MEDKPSVLGRIFRSIVGRETPAERWTALHSLNHQFLAAKLFKKSHFADETRFNLARANLHSWFFHMYHLRERLNGAHLIVPDDEARHLHEQLPRIWPKYRKLNRLVFGRYKALPNTDEKSLESKNLEALLAATKEWRWVCGDDCHDILDKNMPEFFLYSSEREWARNSILKRMSDERRNKTMRWIDWEKSRLGSNENRHLDPTADHPKMMSETRKSVLRALASMGPDSALSHRSIDIAEFHLLALENEKYSKNKITEWKLNYSASRENLIRAFSLAFQGLSEKSLNEKFQTYQQNTHKRPEITVGPIHFDANGMERLIARFSDEILQAHCSFSFRFDKLRTALIVAALVEFDCATYPALEFAREQFELNKYQSHQGNFDEKLREANHAEYLDIKGMLKSQGRSRTEARYGSLLKYGFPEDQDILLGGRAGSEAADLKELVILAQSHNIMPSGSSWTATRIEDKIEQLQKSVKTFNENKLSDEWHRKQREQQMADERDRLEEMERHRRDEEDRRSRQEEQDKLW